MADNIVNVKEAIWDFISTQVTNTGNGFAQYFLTPNQQIYWEWTRSDVRNIFPYIYLEVEADETIGQSAFHSYEKRTVNNTTKFYRIDKQYHVFSVGINICTMTKDDLSLNGLQAQNLGSSIARLLRRKFMSDESTDWFAQAYNNDTIQIGVQTEEISNILYLPEYEDTKPKHRYRFTCTFNWTDTFETISNLAAGANIISINEETTNILITPN